MKRFLSALLLCCLSHSVTCVASPMHQQQQHQHQHQQPPPPPPASSVSLPLTSDASTGLPWLQQQLQALRDDCHQTGPLGLISGQIRDWQLTASSTYPQEWDSGCHERYARLYQPNKLGWCAKYKSASEWLQVDLGVITKVTGVMTQGRNDGSEWVTSFMLSHSFDGRHWSYVIDQYGNQKVFEGNMDSYAAKYSYLDEPVFARFVRFHTVTWNRHPSMRVELIGCQVCNVPLSLPPAAKVSASSEKWQSDGGSCQAESAYIFTNKAWCAKTDNNNQWLQFDIGPPTLITGLISRGRGDEGRNHWVKRFRLSYSNDSSVWYFYKDTSHLDAKRTWDLLSRERSSANRSSHSVSSQFFIPNRQSLEGLEFGANSNKHEERYHFLNSPFTARYVRFHPVDWHRHISMRAGLIGCPFKGDCVNGFMRINDESPCVENLAYHKDSFVNKRHLKRHIRNQWIRGQASRAVDGRADQDINNCTILDNYQVDKPTWMVDLGRKVKVAGVKIQTWTGNETGLNTDISSTSNRDYMHNLEKLVVYVDNKAGKDKIDHPGNICGGVSRLNDALYRPKLHVPCKRPLQGRYVYIEAWGMADRPSRLFSAVLCEVWVYE